MIKVILEILFGVTVGTHLVYSGPGMFGQVSAYFGVVESQVCATLHLHLLLWSASVPSMDIMEDLLKQATF